jgi:hypothetical protein
MPDAADQVNNRLLAEQPLKFRFLKVGDSCYFEPAAQETGPFNFLDLPYDLGQSAKFPTAELILCYT